MNYKDNYSNKAVPSSDTTGIGAPNASGSSSNKLALIPLNGWPYGIHIIRDDDDRIQCNRCGEYGHDSRTCDG